MGLKRVPPLSAEYSIANGGDHSLRFRPHVLTDPSVILTDGYFQPDSLLPDLSSHLFEESIKTLAKHGIPGSPDKGTDLALKVASDSVIAARQSQSSVALEAFPYEE